MFKNRTHKNVVLINHCAKESIQFKIGFDKRQIASVG